MIVLPIKTLYDWRPPESRILVMKARTPLHYRTSTELAHNSIQEKEEGNPRHSPDFLLPPYNLATQEMLLLVPDAQNSMPMPKLSR